MRLVLWNSQERVDLPDMQASETSHLGEHRRLVRGLLIGPNGASFDNYLVRGFAVEASAVPDDNIHVKLDPGGANPRSVAIGRDADFPDAYGTIVGGNDDQGNLEGNADYPLPFTGQPNGTYTVYMRFLFTDGSNDNRAQWNPGLNTESVVAMNTQRLPSIELSLNPAGPSDGWIPLADVAWGGATIVAGNITDVRSFVFEGSSPYQQATQTGSGGMADFSRSSARGTNGVNEVYPVLRALGRQIQDLKGQDDSGNFNWWNRPAKPYDPAAALTAGHTKSLRTVETVTYTVGDGVDFFGDFNGVDGLDDCLAHIEASISATTATQTKYVVLLRANGDAYFNLGTYDFGALGAHISLIGQGAYPAGSPVLEQVVINPTTTDDTPSLECSSTGSTLRLENLVFDPFGAATPLGRVYADWAGRVEVTNCTLRGATAATASSTTARAITAGTFAFRDALFLGLYALGSGRMQDCEFRTATAFFLKSGVDGPTGIHAVGCKFSPSQDFAISNAAVVLQSAHDAHFTDCTFQQDYTLATGSSRDLVKIITGFLQAAPSDIWFTGCRFYHYGNTAGAVDGGANTTNGTGWMLFVTTADRVHVTGCALAGGIADTRGSTDAGAIYLASSSQLQIRGNNFYGFKYRYDLVNARCDVIKTDGSCGFLVIEGNTFQSLQTPTSGANTGDKLVWVALADDGVRIAGNSFTASTVAYSVIMIELADTVCDRTTIANNSFQSIDTPEHVVDLGLQNDYCVISGNAFDVDDCDCVIGGSQNAHVSVAGNTFVAAAGTTVVSVTGSYCAVTGNTFELGSTGLDGIFVGGNSRSTVTGNTGRYTTTPGRFIVSTGGTADVIIGNASNGDVDSAAPTTGYNEAQDVNNIGSYV